MIIQQNLPYKLIQQQPYCCVPACIAMILDRRNIPHGIQEEIGYELGLIVPKKEERLFLKVRTGKKPISGWGTQVQKKHYSINKYFGNYNIPLQERTYHVEELIDVATFIADNLKDGNDIIVCFEYGKLFGKGNWGHACLIDSIDINHRIITLLDPEVKVKREVSLEKLVYAIKVHEKKGGAFWLITSNHASQRTL